MAPFEFYLDNFLLKNIRSAVRPPDGRQRNYLGRLRHTHDYALHDGLCIWECLTFASWDTGIVTPENYTTITRSDIFIYKKTTNIISNVRHVFPVSAPTCGQPADLRERTRTRENILRLLNLNASEYTAFSKHRIHTCKENK